MSIVFGCFNFSAPAGPQQGGTSGFLGSGMSHRLKSAVEHSAATAKKLVSKLLPISKSASPSTSRCLVASYNQQNGI